MIPLRNAVADFTGHKWPKNTMYQVAGRLLTKIDVSVEEAPISKVEVSRMGKVNVLNLIFTKLGENTAPSQKAEPLGEMCIRGASL